MKKRLRVGITSLSNEWKMLLDQIGCSYEGVTFHELYHAYSCIILTNELSSDERSHILKYIEDGGAVIDYFGKNFFQDEPPHLVPKKYIINSSDRFRESFIDLHRDVCVVKQNQYFEGAIHFNHEEHCCFWGIPISSLLETDYTRKRFLDNDRLFPTEIVNKVSKGALRRTFEDTLTFLHKVQGLPFIKKSNFENEQTSGFLFRVDTDYSNRSAIQSLYKLAHKHNMPLSWFLHISAHESWLDEFKTMENQEIAVHGYKHGTSSSHSKIKADIENARKELERHHIEYSGYCAPYGIWSPELAAVIDENKFAYSSEFTLNYDDLPFELVTEGGEYQHLQIPIHPICIGSFHRKKASSESMMEYFDSYISQQHSWQEPIALYHHPMQEGLDVLEHVINTVRTRDIPCYTFDQMATYWRKREAHTFDAFFENEEVEIQPHSEYDMYYQVNWNGLNSSSSVSKLHFSMNDLEYENREAVQLLSTATVKELRHKSINDYKLSLLDWYRRERL